MCTAPRMGSDAAPAWTGRRRQGQPPPGSWNSSAHTGSVRGKPKPPGSPLQGRARPPAGTPLGQRPGATGLPCRQGAAALLVGPLQRRPQAHRLQGGAGVRRGLSLVDAVYEAVRGGCGRSCLAGCSPGPSICPVSDGRPRKSRAKGETQHAPLAPRTRRNERVVGCARGSIYCSWRFRCFLPL